MENKYICDNVIVDAVLKLISLFIIIFIGIPLALVLAFWIIYFLIMTWPGRCVVALAVLWYVIKYYNPQKGKKKK